MEKFEDIIHYIESLIILLTIPYMYLERMKSKYDRLRELIDHLSNMIVYRISSDRLISRYEIKLMISSSLLKNGLKSDDLMIDDVLDEVILKIDSNPFLERELRLKNLQKIIFIGKSERSRQLKWHQFIKNHKISIINSIIVVIVLFTIFLPGFWRIMNSGEGYRQFLYTVGVGAALIIIINILRRVYKYLFDSVVKMDEPSFDLDSYKLIPPYRNEKLTFINDNEYMDFKLSFVDVSYKDKIVETDSGFLSMGLVQYVKRLKKYKLSFVNDFGLTLDISIEVDSRINGTRNFDIITYEFNDSVSKNTYQFINRREFIFDQMKEDDIEHFLKDYGIPKGYKSKSCVNIGIILKDDKRLHGIICSGKFWRFVD